MKNTRLTVTIQGICEDEQGMVQIIDRRYEDLDAVFLNAFKLLEGDKYVHDSITMGGFTGHTWSKCIEAMARVMTEEGEDYDYFLSILEFALMNIAERAKAKDAENFSDFGKFSTQ